MNYPHSKIAAAAQVVHNNYSEVDMFDATTGDLDWAEATVRAAIERLGEPDEMAAVRRRNTELRKAGLANSEVLSRIWRTMFFGRQPETSDHNEMADAIVEGLQSKLPPPEVTDQMVEDFISVAFLPSVVIDRVAVRAGLAYALQTR